MRITESQEQYGLVVGSDCDRTLKSYCRILREEKCRYVEWLCRIRMVSLVGLNDAGDEGKIRDGDGRTPFLHLGLLHMTCR